MIGRVLRSGRRGVMAAIVVASGCASFSAERTGAELLASNEPNVFQLSFNASTVSTETNLYAWHNDNALVVIQQSGQLTGGSARLTLKDADGTVVYDGDLSRTGSFVADSGATGVWTVAFDLFSATGSIVFSIGRAN